MSQTLEEKFQNYSQTSITKVQKDCQEALYHNRLKLWKKAFAPLKHEITHAKRICDFGTGPGEFLVFLRTMTQAELTGYDPSSSQIERARIFFKDDIQVHLTQKKPDHSEKFDLVFCNHVIEHVPDEDLDEFMKDLTEIVAPGGKLVIATPNGLNPFSYTYFMASDFTHIRMHSPFTLAEVLDLKNFDLVSVHRELPQVYDLQTFAKYLVWAFFSAFAKLAILSHAGGVRGLAYPLIMASTFYGVATRKKAP